MNWFGDLLVTALYTAFVQNLVFSGGYGASEAFRLSYKPRKLFAFAIMISCFSVSTSALCHAAERFFLGNHFSVSTRVLVYSGILAAVYLIAALVFRFILSASKDFLSILGMAALNTMVLAIPFLNQRSAYSFADSVGSGLGAGVAFIIAAVLIASGVRNISRNEKIPEAFRGTPAMFLYVGLLSLAFTGFSDSTIFS